MAIVDHFEEFLGAYMFLALAMALFTGFPVAFSLGGVALIFGGLAIFFDYMNFQNFFIIMVRIWGGDGASGAVQNPVLVAIPCFIFMGTMLERSGVAADLLHILQVLLRRVPGGLALSVTVMGTIMAATTGIIGASVVMMTLLALGTMLERGYSKALATGTIASSSTLGILIPPSIMLVIMASLLSVSVGNLFVGAFLPGLMLSGLYFVYILTVSTLKPESAPPLPEDAVHLSPTNMARLKRYFIYVGGIVLAAVALSYTPLEEHLNIGLTAFLAIFVMSMTMGRDEGDSLFGSILKGFVPPVFLVTLVLGSILAGWATPTEAAGVGAFGSLVLAWFNRTLTKDVLSDVVNRTTMTTSMIFFIFVGATTFSYIFRTVYGEDLIIEFIEFLDLHNWALLFILMFVVFILGFFFDWLEITLIVLPVFAPVVRNEMAQYFAAHLGMEGAFYLDVQTEMIYWYAILVAINLQTSFLTPPFGFALFYMKGVSPPEVKMQDIYSGIIPFVFLQLIGLAFVVAFPQIALWLPAQLLD